MLKVLNILLLVIVVNGQTTTTSFTEPVTPPAFTTRTLDKFSQTNHLRSDAVQILNPKTFLIPNFHFDGNVPSAHFVAGSGLPSPTNRGTFIPFEDAADAPLAASYGQNLHLSLPKDLTIEDIDWLAVWSDQETKPVEFIWTKNKTIQSKYPPQTLNLLDKATSGPVVLVNKKTLFIPNLRYQDNNYEDVHFCAGNGTDPFILPNCRVVPDENGSVGNLHAYQGENIYLNLPEGTTTDNTDFFGVYWKESSLGHVRLKGIPNVPEATSDATAINTSVIRVPKCCPLTAALSDKGCEEMNIEVFAPKFNLFEHNSTHLNNNSLHSEDFTYEPYVYPLVCPKYPLSEDQESFGLLQNGSLIVNGLNLKRILSQGEFCVDFVDMELLVLVCAPEEKINQGMFKAYLALLIISTLCLIGAIIVYCIFYEHSDLHKKCFTFYAFSMCVTFICQIIVQVTYIDNETGCVVIGFFFQIAMIVSFAWLAILCFDILSIILNFTEDMRKGIKRFLWYIGVVLAVALISLIVSISRNLVPDVPNSFFKPQFKRNSCYFEEEQQRSIYFYVPIGLSIVLSCIFLGFSKYYITKFDKEKEYDYFWIGKKITVKFLLKQGFITWCIMVISWISNLLMNIFDDTNGVFNAMNIIEALQGVLVVVLFFAHHYYHLKRKTNEGGGGSNQDIPDDWVEMNGLRNDNE